MGVPQQLDGFYERKSQSKMDDKLGVPPLMETPKWLCAKTKNQNGDFEENDDKAVGSSGQRVH